MIRDRDGRAVRHIDQQQRIALAHSRETNPRYRLALAVIIMHNGSGDAYPSLRTIADLVGCNRTTAWRAVQHLAALGEITVIRGRGGPRNTRVSNRYHPSISCPPDCHDPAHVEPAVYYGPTPF